MIPTTGKNLHKTQDVRVTCPGWFNMELSNEASFTLSSLYYDHCKMSFTHFHSSSSQGNLFLHQNHATYYSKLCLRKWGQTDKDYWKKFVTKLYLASIAKDKDPSIRVKMHQIFFLYFFHYFPYIFWVDVTCLTHLVFLKSPW